MGTRKVIVRTLAVMFALFLPEATSAQLHSAYMVPAAAHTQGERGTFWMSDVSLHNPHVYDLPVVVQLLPSGSENWEVLTLDLTLYPWETVNLWDALGPDVFASGGTGALLAYVNPDAMNCGQEEACGFLTSSRTYTLDPLGTDGEFGQTIPGLGVAEGMDWTSYGYAAGILNDGVAFRCNVGVASWTAGWTTVQVDVQEASGEIIATEELVIPPFGHLQRRLGTDFSGGSLVFYLVDGPDDALVFPYASVISQETGDASFSSAIASVIGVSVDKDLSATRRLGSLPGIEGERLEFGSDTLGRAARPSARSRIATIE